MLGLMDLDPDGMSILRCYRHGSEKLSHEANACTSAIQWLGIRTHHLLEFQKATSGEEGNGDLDESCRAAMPSTTCQEPISYLTKRDRKMALRMLSKLSDELQDSDTSEMRSELQNTLVLGCKAEIEWLDDSGNLFQWLDREITEALLASH